CSGPQEIVVTGCSFGAFHAANFSLKRADLFPLALCQSGVYDMSDLAGGEQGNNFYFNNPMDYVANMHGDHLDWLRQRLSLVLVCGQGQWEDSTGSLESTTRFGRVLADKELRHEVDLWGHDIPHDWPSWRNQLAHHLPRFC
ncbi:MAG: esterase, partial [Actinobacteria bacterium]|nr:esterase [Actinomycetota bacterium]